MMVGWLVFCCSGPPWRAANAHGDGSQSRSFCYVSDLVEGLILLMNSPHSGPINLGNLKLRFGVANLGDEG